MLPLTMNETKYMAKRILFINIKQHYNVKLNDYIDYEDKVIFSMDSTKGHSQTENMQPKLS